MLSSSRVSDVAALSIRLPVCAENTRPPTTTHRRNSASSSEVALLSLFLSSDVRLISPTPPPSLLVTLQVPLPPGRPSGSGPYTAQCLTSLSIRLWGHALDQPNFWVVSHKETDSTSGQQPTHV